jgi:hypothetical protein
MGITIMPERASLQMARCKAATVEGVATINEKIPGTPGVDEGRVVSGGAGWFETQHPDDHVEVYLVDKDNITGAGVDAVVGSYTETDIAADYKGWFICQHKKILDIRQLEQFGHLPAGLYLQIIATKGDLSADTFRINLKWGKNQ